MTASSGGFRVWPLRGRSRTSTKYDLSDPIGREAHFRAQLLRATTAGLFLVSTSLITVLLPFYPIGLAVILALVVAIIGYVLPPLGFLTSIIVSIPSLAYQTGVPLWWLGILAIFGLGFFVRILLDPSNVFGPTIGIIAVAVTLTPAYFLAIPLMIAIVLFRAKEKFFAPVGPAIMFLMFFIPIHQAEFASLLQLSLGAKLQIMRAEEIYDAMNSLTIPLFRQASSAPRPAPESFDLPALSEAFDVAFRPGKFFHSYLFLMIDRLIILFFPVLITMTLSLSLVIRRFWYWLKGETVATAPFLKFSPFFTVILATAIFIAPLLALASPLRYFTAITSTSSQAVSGGTFIGALLASAGATGLLVSIISQWLSHRDLTASIVSAILRKSKELLSTLSDTIGHLSKVMESSEGIDISQEIAQANRANEDVKLTIQNLDTMKLSVLSDRLSRFYKIGEELPRIQSSANRKLLQIYLDKVSKYNTIVEHLRSFGMHYVQRLPEPDPVKEAEKSRQELVSGQLALNQEYLELAKKTLEVTRNVIGTIRSNFESIDLTSVEVAKRFVDDRRGEVALDYMINTLSQLNERYGQIIAKIIEKENSITRRVLEIYSFYIVPIYETLGKAESSTKSYSLIAELRTMLDVSGPIGIAFLTEAMNRFQRLREGLSAITAELVSQLKELESLNDSRAPGFNWGKNATLSIELEGALKLLESKGRLGIDDRIANAEAILASIEEAAKVTSQYMIMSELILQYPIFEPMIATKLREAGMVRSEQVPAGQKYAKEYLRLYASRHPSECSYDIMSNKLQLKR